ncbi:MAG: phosphoenolpyruvate--protein phosphotransferase [Gammaproteobacteria bacterium]|nr:phosphoenolpyruvate--protein phosphotransferase [Gammaproteobacteria bacterium]MCH9743945.1 phosphoenolpyruvate--protein phosphotransferase [Gammaproteobacteria bacterium]
MLTTLKRMMQEISAIQDLTVALNFVVENVCEALNADACSIFLADDEHGEYILSASHGLNPDALGKTRLKFATGLIGLVGEREEPINVEDAAEQPENQAVPALKEQDLHGFMGVPIIFQGELLGVIAVQQKRAACFEEEQEAFLVTFSAQFAGELASAMAKGKLQEIKTPKKRGKKQPTILSGLAGAPGIAVGHAIVVYPPADFDAVPDRPTNDIKAEIVVFEEALHAARDDIQQIQERAKNTFSIAENALFDAYLRILDSRSLMQEIETEIEKGQWAQSALKHVIQRHILQFESLDDPYLRERASDFRDLGRRILSYLQLNKRTTPDYPKNTILVSEEVTATMLMEIPEGCLKGVISASGSNNSHVAILARALGLPTIMGITGAVITDLIGKEIVVDGYHGQAYINPSAAVKKEFKALVQEEQQLEQELETLRELPAETTDAHRIALYINTGLATDGGLSLSVGAEGVGLYRTEMPFMLRDRFPSEEEQRVMYRQLLNVFAPRPVVMRTLDIGGDKNLPYFPITEENPFLGWRGIRITLDHPDIFLQQVRAMLQASDGLKNLSIMLPMVSSISEVESAKRLIDQAYHEVREEGLKIKQPRLGLMIEVPSAVYQSYELAKRVDFLSVGSNDLIQYLLAVDRNNPRVAKLYNGLHPAVLKALQYVVKNGRKARKKVSICGELAGNPIAVILLLGMGYHSLSMNARSLPRVKWLIRNFSLKQARQLVREVMQMDDPVEVRCHMEMALEEAGLTGLIRAGK